MVSLKVPLRLPSYPKSVSATLKNALPKALIENWKVSFSDAEELAVKIDKYLHEPASILRFVVGDVTALRSNATVDEAPFVSAVVVQFQAEISLWLPPTTEE